MPRVTVVVGAKMYKGREWRSGRALIMRQIEISGRIWRKMLEGITTISILAWTRRMEEARG